MERIRLSSVRRSPLWLAALLLGTGFLPSPSGPSLAQQGPSGANARIEFSAFGFRSDEGSMRCLLFEAGSAASFPMQARRAFAAAMSRISARRATCRFDDVPPGRYAASLHHDADADGQVDVGLFGIPTEGLGASNDARGTMGPPSFEAAAFNFTGGELRLRVRIDYVF